MTPSIDFARIAVLDIGKTNLKLFVATDDGWPLESRSIPNAASASGPYLAYDVARLEEWVLDALADVARRHAIRAVISTAHGCGAVLVDEDKPVLPMMDYEAVPPPAIDEAYARIAPPYGEVFCGIGAGAMRLAKQLLWQESAFPTEFARAKAYLTTAQFFAVRLGGRAASEISQLAAQSHIWDLRHRRPSSIMRERGWARLLPQLVPAGASLGTISEVVAKRTGLARSTEVLCGVHDSNANLYRYKAAGMADASILSTGTWMICFQREGDLDRLNANGAMVLNIDVDGKRSPRMPLSLMRWRPWSGEVRWHCRLSWGTTAYSLARPITAASLAHRPKPLLNGKDWRSFIQHLPQTVVWTPSATQTASS
jgi:sugar (pentulose or hexulose) kinase